MIGWVTLDQKLIYCFDIDGTICTNTDGSYSDAGPFPDRIDHINRLFLEGHVIRMFTARGSTTGIDWRETTELQLGEWGLKYHELILGKPFAHIFVDDRAVHSESYAWD